MLNLIPKQTGNTALTVYINIPDNFREGKANILGYEYLQGKRSCRNKYLSFPRKRESGKKLKKSFSKNAF